MKTGRARMRHKNRRHPGYGTNRVYESSGPDGKIRGNTHQLVEKYRAMARDARLSGDQIVAENYAQHAEHYVRLAGYLREQEAQRAAQANARHGGANKSNGSNQSGHAKKRHARAASENSSKDAGEAATL